MGRTLHLFISNNFRKHEFTLFAVEQTLSKGSIICYRNEQLLEMKFIKHLLCVSFCSTASFATSAKSVIQSVNQVCFVIDLKVLDF